MLKKRWSPEIIAHKLKGLVSHTTIYCIIRRHRCEWRKYLIYQRKGKYHNSKAGKEWIPNRQDITLRPECGFGDWEADTVIGGRGGRSCLGVFVERTTRMYRVVKMMNKTADEMIRATLIALDEKVVKSITYDNGAENAGHETVNRLLGCVSWFCRPYRSGDKGLVENRNKWLRVWLPKRTNFDLIDNAELARIENAINERPMKCLGWQTPAQVFHSSSSFNLIL
jgi:IS30 family transposase